MELLRKVICYVPTLRFPDFSEEWRSTPMKNVCSFAKGYGIAKENLSAEGTPCILYGELYTYYKTAIAKDIRSKTQLDPTDLFHSKANDVIIPCSGETAIDIATSVCVPYDDVLLGGDLTVIRTKLNGAFLSNQLNSVRRKKIATIAQGASIVHLHADELKKINITYPTSEEQDKIAHFIDCLDERIATQNKIIKNKKSLIISLIIEILLSVLSLVESFLSLNLFSMINNLLKLLWTIFKEVKRIWSKKKHKSNCRLMARRKEAVRKKVNVCSLLAHR